MAKNRAVGANKESRLSIRVDAARKAVIAQAAKNVGHTISEFVLGNAYQVATELLAADERVAGVEFTEDVLSVALKDGRTISVPLAWYPRLLDATPEQRKKWHIAGGGYGIHWPDIDEDLNTEGLLRGAPAPGPRKSMSQPRKRSSRRK